MTILTEAQEKGATDIHFSQDAHLFWRLNGKLHQGPFVDQAMFQQLLQELKENDFQGRVTTYKANGKEQVAVRLFPSEVPAFRTLGLPVSLLKLAEQKEGLILFTGPTGSGKTTSMASFVEAMMAREALHVMTFENPIEYQLNPREGLLQQCEEGRDYTDLEQALYQTLRTDADVMMIGELRRPEEIRMALLAAETGHLVIAGMHARNIDQVVSSMLLRFPEREAQALKESFAHSVQAVINQRLLPTTHDNLTLVADVMLATPATRQGILKERPLYVQMESELQKGHILMAAMLADKVRQGMVLDSVAEKLLADEEVGYNS